VKSNRTTSSTHSCLPFMLSIHTDHLVLHGARVGWEMLRHIVGSRNTRLLSPVTECTR